MSAYIDDIRHTYDFDSRISPPHAVDDRANFELTLILRLFLHQVNPPSGKSTFRFPDIDGRLWPVLRWNRASWIDFRKRYLKLVSQVWDKAFILIPPAAYNGFVWPNRGKRRNLLCRLGIQVLDSEKEAHATIKVVRLATPTKTAFRSHSGLLDSEDIKLSRTRFRSEGASFTHNIPAHEIGHLLGLPHAGLNNPRCVDDQSGACYGSNLVERMNVMGGGSMLDLSQARPWQVRAPLHVTSTSSKDWKTDWASSEAALRGLEGLKVDESHKVQRPKPGMIDL